MGSIFEGIFGPSTNTSSSSSVSSNPDWFMNAAKGVTGRAVTAASQPYALYPGARVAGFSPDQRKAFDLTRSNAGNWQPLLSQAGSTVDSALGKSAAGAASPYLDRASQTFPDAASAYMSPYTDAVVDRIGDLGARNLFEKVLPGVNDTFIGGGTFGGKQNSEFVSRALRDTQEGILGESAKALEAGYGTAANIFGADQSRLADVGKTAGSLTGTDAGYGLEGARQYASLADQKQAQGLKDAAALQAIGGQQQGLEQKSLDLAHDDFEAQRDYDKNNVQWLSGILGGQANGMPKSTSSTTETPGASPLSQLLGAGLTLADLTDMFGTAKKRGGMVRGYAEGGMVEPTLMARLANMETSDLRLLGMQANDPDIRRAVQMQLRARGEDVALDQLAAGSQDPEEQRSLRGDASAARSKSAYGDGPLAAMGRGMRNFGQMLNTPMDEMPDLHPGMGGGDVAPDDAGDADMVTGGGDSGTMGGTTDTLQPAARRPTITMTRQPGGAYAMDQGPLSMQGARAAKGTDPTGTVQNVPQALPAEPDYDALYAPSPEQMAARKAYTDRLQPQKRSRADSPLLQFGLQLMASRRPGLVPALGEAGQNVLARQSVLDDRDRATGIEQARAGVGFADTDAAGRRAGTVARQEGGFKRTELGIRQQQANTQEGLAQAQEKLADAHADYFRNPDRAARSAVVQAQKEMENLWKRANPPQQGESPQAYDARVAGAVLEASQTAKGNPTRDTATAVKSITDAVNAGLMDVEEGKAEIAAIRAGRQPTGGAPASPVNALPEGARVQQGGKIYEKRGGKMVPVE